ncbi:MAG: ABC transporter substrate-binding protein [Lachnospiraceae bacterium]|nr:ABC transporter substrate-binding protein [Lachnospiraceae bacterium]
MKKRRLLALVLALSLALTACSGSSGSSSSTTAASAETTASEGETSGTEETAASEAATSSSKDTLVIANTSGEPGNLHPYNTVSVGAVMAQLLVFNSLITLDENGEAQPSLAESWEVTEDSITFTLREGVTFSNGDELTVDDVIFSMQEMMLNSTGGKATNYTACDAENITATDDRTVVVPLTEANSSQLSYFEDIFIVDKSVYEEMGDQYQYEPVGTGPFVLSEWVVGDHMTFTRNENYWDGAALLETVTIRTISEVSQAMIEVETGGADVMISPDGSDVERVLNGEIDGVKAVTDDTLVLRNNNVNFNHNSEYMSNKLVREAIAYCIDRESWTSIISPGTGTPAYCNIASGIWGWDESMSENYPYQYDLEKAKECLEEAGYADGFTCVLYTDNRTYHQALAELLQASLSEIGIDMQIETMELAKQKELMATGEGYDLFLLDNVGSSGDPLSALWRDSHPQFSGEGGSNYLWYTLDKEGAQDYADILDAIRACYDDTEKMELCLEMQQIFTENLIWLPINSIQSYVLATESLEGLSFRQDVLKITNATYFS